MVLHMSTSEFLGISFVNTNKSWVFHMSSSVNKVREYRRGIRKWTIQRNWQHRVHKTKNKTNQKHNTICVGHHYAQTNTNDVNNTRALLRTTGGKDERLTSCFCQLCHWRGQVTFQSDNDDICFVLDRQAEFNFYSARSLKQESLGRHVAPLGHIILIMIQPVFAITL